MSGALDGVRILDLDCDLSGSYACMLLGDMGAEVVKIEPVGGNERREDPAFRLWNRGRRSVAADLDKAEGKAVLRRLVADCDVVVETLRASEAQQRAVDYDSLVPSNPHLVYCAMPPFGESGPLADLPADDGVVNAYSGVYGDQGGVGQPPIYLHLPIASYGAAFLAAFGISAALYTRQMSGQGQKLEVPWYNGSVAMQSGNIVDGPAVRSWLREARGQQGANPAYQLYECQDEWMILGAGNATFWNKLCIALEVEYLVEDPRFEDAPWNIPVEHREPLRSLLSEKFRQRPREYWLQRLSDYDVPCAPVESREWFTTHPQVVHNGILVEVDDPVLGRSTQMGLPLTLHETPGRVAPPVPGLGQHTREMLSELGYDADEISNMSAQGVIKELEHL